MGLNQNEAYTCIAFSVDIPAKALVKNAINALQLLHVKCILFQYWLEVKERDLFALKYNITH